MLNALYKGSYARQGGSIDFSAMFNHFSVSYIVPGADWGRLAFPLLNLTWLVVGEEGSLAQPASLALSIMPKGVALRD